MFVGPLPISLKTLEHRGVDFSFSLDVNWISLGIEFQSQTDWITSDEG